MIEDENILRELIAKLNGWELLKEDKGGNVIFKLSKKVKLNNFTSALDYFNKIGAIAEEINHHPDLHLTGFNNIQILIFTFSLNGLTQKDFNLAEAIDIISL